MGLLFFLPLWNHSGPEAARDRHPHDPQRTTGSTQLHPHFPKPKYKYKMIILFWILAGVGPKTPAPLRACKSGPFPVLPGGGWDQEQNINSPPWDTRDPRHTQIPISVSEIGSTLDSIRSFIIPPTVRAIDCSRTFFSMLGGGNLRRPGPMQKVVHRVCPLVSLLGTGSCLVHLLGTADRCSRLVACCLVTSLGAPT